MVKVNGKYETYKANFKVKVYSEPGEDSGGSVELPKDVIYYSAHPGVPDFGALLGITTESITKKSDGTVYAYDPRDIAAKDPDNSAIKDYTALLQKCGFKYAGGGYDSNGNSIVKYENSATGWRVTLGGDSSTYSILIIVTKI